MQIEPKRAVGKVALFYLGFRPFFLGAALFASIGIGLWAFMYAYGINPPQLLASPMRWHAHEMLYGYTLAVIAGFLLTAVKNWTGIQTLDRWPLAGLVLLWLGSRVLALSDMVTLFIGFELLFLLALISSVVVPVLRARQWHQSLIVVVLCLLFVGDALYLAGLWYFDPQWQARGLDIGFYTILLLIFFMARRVVPFFIERGVDPPVTVRNFRWLDVSSIVLLIGLGVLDISPGFDLLSAALAIALFVLHGIRLVIWHTPQLWRKPLLWSLYVAYAWLTLGFLLKGLSFFAPVPAPIALHAFAYGGIGLITMGMMARVTLGHTGRDVFRPPVIVNVMFALLVIGAVVRVVMPLLLPVEYRLWIIVSGGLWALAFLLFVLWFGPMWIRPRVDGHYG